MDDSHSIQVPYDSDSSVEPSRSRFCLLKSILSKELQAWVPKEILSIPCKLSPANKELLFRKYGITELHWAALTRSITDAGDLLNRGADVHKTTLRSNRRRSGLDRNEIEGVTSLFLAARCGHAALVDMLLEHGAVDDILKAGTKGDTALHAASLSGDVGVMRLMLSALVATPQGRDAVDVKGYKARTSLHYAAGRGLPAIVGALLQAGAAVCASDEYGATPFHFAAGWGNNIPCLDLLMGLPRRQHVDEAKDNKGWTALHYAAGYGQLSAAQWLLDQGASVNARASLHGNAPLHLAAKHPDVIRVLTASGADIWLENDHGQDAIGLAHNQKDTLAVKAHIRAIRTGTREEDVDPFAEHGKDRVTLLHYVSAYGTAEDMAWIQGLSAFQEEFRAASTASTTDLKINKTDNNGLTAIHWAAIGGNVEALRCLAKHKADLSAADKEGRNVVCLAIAYSKAGHMEFLQAFLALPSVKLQVQKWVSHTEAARWMKEYYVIHNLEPSMVFRLKKLQKTRTIVRRFITHSFQHVLETFKGSHRHHAHHFGQMDRATSLKEALPGTRFTSAHNALNDLPPIYLALHADREDIVKIMQEHAKGSAWQDAVVNRKGEETQRTALHWAIIFGEPHIVSKLCTSDLFSKDLKPNVEDKYGKTPLQYAKELNQAVIEKQLMERKDVKNYLEALYRDRQVYVDATNAVLVAAALIASVTFVGWLQPPLNYVTYYDMPLDGAPDSAYAAYAAVQQHVGLRVFWGFNSLSFTFAIATVLAGLVGVVPVPSRYIATTVAHLRRTLWVASAMLTLSIVFVLGAFAAAGFTVLPPRFKYEIVMLITIIVGGIPCILLLVWFAGIPCVARNRIVPASLSTTSPPPPPPQLPLRSSSHPWERDDPSAWVYNA